MRFFLLFSLCVSLLLAEQREKIALVLSGGGARGGAHVGVLKALEEYKIPIDFIVGTSMGSYMGGLYAIGKTPQEVEEMLLTTDWHKYIRTDFDRTTIPMRKKKYEYTYQGRLGLGIDVQNNLVIPTGVLKRQNLLFLFSQQTSHAENIHDFSDFSIPFKAIATNIKNGEAVILDSGSLAQSIYASSAIPGGLQPINIDGVDLVDGGVSNNFPIQVAKDMGADIVIAVDVSEDFAPHLDVNSYFVVMNQLVDILVRKNANESIKGLGKNDIIITPDLNGFSTLDADKYAFIIEKGYQAAKSMAPVLQKYSLSDAAYEEYKMLHRYHNDKDVPIIDAIEIQNPTYLSDSSLLNRLHVALGEPLDEAQLQEDLLLIYNMMLFDSVTYEVVKKEQGNVLKIITTPSWDNHGEVRFALGLEDDFMGHSNYSIKLGYTMFGLNSYAGEWRNDFEIGSKQRVSTEWYQPLDDMQRFYIRPSLSYEDRLDTLPAQRYNLSSNGTFDLEVTRYGYAMACGIHLGTSYEFEVGLGSYEDSLVIATYDLDKKFNAKPLYGSFLMDNLDNLNFPNAGQKVELRWTKEMQSLGSDYDYEQIYVDAELPLTYRAHNITLYAKYGNTYKNDITALAGSFSLGGLFNLSGYVPYSLNDDSMFLNVAKYRYQIKDGGFFGALNVPLYIGGSLEMGSTWQKDSDFNAKNIKKSATIYVAADTVLGPFYLAYGVSDEGESSGYLYLGEKF
jgi:NTE family protein